jgi:hypothetical protein
MVLRVELKQHLPLGRNVEVTYLLRGCPLARDPEGVLEVGGVDLLEHLLIDPLEAHALEEARITAYSWSPWNCSFSAHYTSSSAALEFAFSMNALLPLVEL